MTNRATSLCITLALSAFGSGGLAGQTAQFEITPQDVLTDERFRLALDGLKPGQEITIRADGNRGVWHSSVTLRSDAAGRAEVPDPMKLVWSATGDRPPAGVRQPMAQPWTFT